MDTTRELVVEVTLAARKLQKLKSTLCQKLSVCDRTLSDLQHCLELENLGLVQMRKIAQKQKVVLLERRKTKNTIQQLESVKVMICAGDMIKKYDIHVRGLAKQKYIKREITLEEALS